MPSAAIRPESIRDPVAEPLRLVDEMGHQDHRDPAVPDPLDQLPGAAPGGRVKARGELVKDHDARLADQGQGNRQPLLLAAGQFPIVVVALGGQAEDIQQFPRVGWLAVERGVQRRCLADPQLFRQRTLLQLDADPLADLGPVALRVQAEHADRP